MEVLKLENLSKYYTSENSVVVGLTGLNLSFSTGEFVALTGESGSGKSTLAHVLGGILPYESGELYIYGKPTSHYDAYDWSKYRRDLISFVSQSYGILPGNTVSENIESALRLSGLSAKEARRRARDILEEVELTEFRRRKAGKLSSGQKQRLSIARALAKPSKILIADEPTGNLDRENSEKVIALLKRATKDRLVILITHEFDEAKDVATRRIVLSDGAVVTDAKLAQVPAREAETQPAPASKKPKVLAPYVCRLTVKSRPVFSAILCLLLAVTTFITFVFLGNFVMALDDSSTRIYDSKAFFNGTPERLVIMRSDGENLTSEDYDALLSYKYVESLERFGYVNDFIYHYQKDIDHSTKDIVVLGPHYDPKTNPNDFTIESYIEFFNKDYGFVRTLPQTQKAILTDGREATGAYEIVSADPKYVTGDTVTVYIRNLNMWSEATYIPLNFEVVGTTSFGEGLYFSDKLASALIYPLPLCNSYSPYVPWTGTYTFLPYAPESFGFSSGLSETFSLADDGFLFPDKVGMGKVNIGTTISLMHRHSDRLTLSCSAKYEAPMPSLVLLSEATFEELTLLSCNQVSVYIKDYAYADRVIDAMAEDGFIAISPFKMGATLINHKLATERLVTLGVCAGTFLISFILQFILLRAMFSSMFEYYRLMSNTGLTAQTAYTAITMTLLLATVVGEALGAGVIFALNAAAVERVVNIFKYLDPTVLAILFILHFVSVAFSLSGILAKLKKNVFGKTKNRYDIDFTLMEDSAL